MEDGLVGALRTWAGSLDPLLLVALAAGALLVALLLIVSRTLTPASSDLDDRLEDMARLQAETTGRLQTMAEILSTRQADLARSLGERMDGLSSRLGANLVETREATGEHLARLAERLAVIDRAQKSMGDLAGEVLNLRQILDNKQTRGAFGQGRMEAIVADALPDGTYSFQATLSNGTRPDCLVDLPNGAPKLVIDAKFPLDAIERMRSAETDEILAATRAQARRDLLKHVVDVRQKYFIPGETHDTALIFVPSESVFADIHEHFPEVVDRAARARVLFVSPSLLMLSIQLVQAVLRDVRMREQAHLIQAEVRHLVEDVGRLQDRALNLQKHFGQATRDVEQLVTSAEKVFKRAGRIDDAAFEAEAERDRLVARG